MYIEKKGSCSLHSLYCVGSRPRVVAADAQQSLKPIGPGWQVHGLAAADQDTGRAIFPGSTTRIEMQAAIYSDDIIGVKRSAERMESLAASYPGMAGSIGEFSRGEAG